MPQESIQLICLFLSNFIHSHNLKNKIKSHWKIYWTIENGIYLFQWKKKKKFFTKYTITNLFEPYEYLIKYKFVKIPWKENDIRKNFTDYPISEFIRNYIYDIQIWYIRITLILQINSVMKFIKGWALATNSNHEVN